MPAVVQVVVAQLFPEGSAAMIGNASRATLALLAGFITGHTAIAQDRSNAGRYPDRPVRLIVPFAPGGSLDIVGRILAQKLTDRFGQPVIVDNRAGATAIIGTDILVKSPPTGYTMMIANIAHGANPYLRKSLPYDTEKDFTPVTLLATLPGLLAVHPGVPARSTVELIALAKTRPGQLTYGSSGSGSSNHLFMELFKVSTGIDIIHIAYKGGGPALVDLVAGQINTMFIAIPPAFPFVKDGKLVALGVSSSKRSNALPDVPTIAQAGIPGFEVNDWLGMLLPAGVPTVIVDRLHREITGVLATADVRERIQGLGADIVTSTPGQLAEHIRKERALWSRVIKQAGIPAD